MARCRQVAHEHHSDDHELHVAPPRGCNTQLFAKKRNSGCTGNATARRRSPGFCYDRPPVASATTHATGMQQPTGALQQCIPCRCSRSCVRCANCCPLWSVRDAGNSGPIPAAEIRVAPGTPYYRWRVILSDGAPFGVCCVPELTIIEMQALYPGTMLEPLPDAHCRRAPLAEHNGMRAQGGRPEGATDDTAPNVRTSRATADA